MPARFISHGHLPDGHLPDLLIMDVCQPMSLRSVRRFEEDPCGQKDTIEVGIRPRDDISISGPITRSLEVVGMVSTRRSGQFCPRGQRGRLVVLVLDPVMLLAECQ